LNLVWLGDLSMQKNYPVKQHSIAIPLLLACLATCSFLTIAALAQDSFRPGEIVLLNRYGTPEEVKVIKQDASGVQVLIKDWQDGTFKPDGYSRYFTPSQLSRREGSQPATTGRVQEAAGYSSSSTVGRTNASGPSPSAGLGGIGPLSKQQIIDYLKARIGTNGPHPRKEEVIKAICQEIKERGVNFKYKYTDVTDFIQAGGETTVGYTVQDNYGEPVKQPWYFDEWDLWFTSTAGFMPSLDSGAKFGFLAIEPNHKYLWKIHADDPASKWIDGNWREATPVELKYQGGPGIVLLDGEQGFDWIVHKDQTAERGQEWINIADLETRQIRRGGKRK
jgi:hypothetical protein